MSAVVNSGNVCQAVARKLLDPGEVDRLDCRLVESGGDMNYPPDANAILYVLLGFSKVIHQNSSGNNSTYRQLAPRQQNCRPNRVAAILWIYKVSASVAPSPSASRGRSEGGRPRRFIDANTACEQRRPDR